MHRIALTSLALLVPILAAVPASAAGETCEGRAATIVAVVGADPVLTSPITGTPGDDVIVGTPLTDTIDGAGGNDVICGLAGADLLTGGEGDDRLFGGLDGREATTARASGHRLGRLVGHGPGDARLLGRLGGFGGRAPTAGRAATSWIGDLVSPGPGNDFVDLGLDPAVDPDNSRPDAVSYNDSPTAVQVDLTPVGGTGRATGEGTDTIVVAGPTAVLGSAHDDHLVGSPFSDAILGGRGSDHIVGGEGADFLFADIGDFDEFLGLTTAAAEDKDHSSPDTVDGGEGQDLIAAQWGSTAVDAGEGNDSVVVGFEKASAGSADGSRVAGGAGDDFIVAKAVRRLHVSGGGGDDAILHSVFDQRGSVVTLGGAGDDVLLLSAKKTGIAASDTVTVDRQRSRLRVNRTVGRMSGYELYVIDGAGLRWEYRGTNGRDGVVVEKAKSLRALTFGGGDVVVGSSGPDHLDLGRGADKADGGRGQDTCIAVERAKSCESRRR